MAAPRHLKRTNFSASFARSPLPDTTAHPMLERGGFCLSRKHEVQFQWPYSTERELALFGPWSTYLAPTCTYRFSGIYAPLRLVWARHFDFHDPARVLPVCGSGLTHDSLEPISTIFLKKMDWKIGIFHIGIFKNSDVWLSDAGCVCPQPEWQSADNPQPLAHADRLRTRPPAPCA